MDASQGHNADELTGQLDDDINDGENGGRFCWAAAGTFCAGQVQGVFA